MFTYTHLNLRVARKILERYANPIPAAKGRFCKRVWFPFGRNESEQNEDDGATRSETREIQVVCYAYIFQTIFENVFCTL